MKTLTPPQQIIVDHITKHGKVDRSELKAHGLDIRAANNLVQARVLTVTNGIYRLDQRTAERESEKAAKAKAREDAKEEAEARKKGHAEAKAALETEAAKRAEEKAAAKATKEAERAKAAEEKAAAKAARPIKNVELHPCLCGCGAATKGRFLAGHDAKLHSLVLRVWRGKARKDELPTDTRTLVYLQGAPWMTPEIRAAVGL